MGEVSSRVTFGRVTVLPEERQLLVDGQPSKLGARAFDVLLVLIEQRDRVVTKEQLLDRVWPGLVVEENNLQVQISALRKALGPQLIATVPGRGYRFNAALGEPQASPSAPRAAVQSGSLLVAVLPFENATGDQTIEYLSDGISESLINKLSRLDGLRVISRTSAFAFKGKELQPIEIGRKLGVDALVVGNLAQRGPRLAITAELVSIGDATQLWGEKYSRQADDMLQVEGEIATTIAMALRRHLNGKEKGQLAQAVTSDPEAYRLYLKGRGFLVGNQQEMDKGVDCFRQAVARAPDYAMAHAGLAEAYTTQAYLRAAGRVEALAKARAAVNRALDLDSDLAEAHAALGLIRFYFEWDWGGADSAFRRALELNAGSGAVLQEYGNFLAAMGRLDEGLVHSGEAARLDPLSVGPAHDVAINALLRGEYEQAAAGFRHAIDIDPNWTWGYVKLARTLSRQGRCEDAFAQAEIAERRIAGGAAPLSWSWLGATYAACGDAARARQKLDQLHALNAKQYVDPVTFAQIHGALGEMDEALLWYERAYSDRTPNMVYAAILPGFSPELVDNPRFAAIVRRMGFPQPTT